MMSLFLFSDGFGKTSLGPSGLLFLDVLEGTAGVATAIRPRTYEAAR